MESAKKIPRGTKRCLRAAGALLLIPEADLVVPVDVKSFRNAISYSKRTEHVGRPEEGMRTVELSCAVRGCPVYLELLTTDGEVRPNAQLWYDTDGCMRT